VAEVGPCEEAEEALEVPREGEAVSALAEEVVEVVGASREVEVVVSRQEAEEVREADSVAAVDDSKNCTSVDFMAFMAAHLRYYSCHGLVSSFGRVTPFGFSKRQIWDISPKK